MPTYSIPRTRVLVAVSAAWTVTLSAIIVSLLLLLRTRVIPSVCAWVMAIDDGIREPDAQWQSCAVSAEGVLPTCLRLLECFRHSMAHNSKVDIRCFPPGFLMVATVHSSSRLVVMTSDQGKTVWVLCRGMNDAHEFKCCLFGSLSQGDLVLGDDPIPVRVHSGMLRLFEEIRDELRVVLDNLHPTTINWIGHSMGSGMAVLGALQAQLSGKGESSVWLVASPRLGSASFAAAVEKYLPGKVGRLVNESDDICFMPPAVLPNPAGSVSYTHVGTELLRFSAQRGSSVVNHDLQVYTNAAMEIRPTVDEMPVSSAKLFSRQCHSHTRG